eukprot:scaffold115566_cov55-Cyclotella_meneghiniana.AAC.4
MGGLMTIVKVIVGCNRLMLKIQLFPAKSHACGAWEFLGSLEFGVLSRYARLVAGVIGHRSSWNLPLSPRPAQPAAPDSP